MPHGILPEFRAKTVRFESGERFPVVVDRSGMPLWDSVAYLWRRRMRGRAVNTLDGNARTLALVHNFLRTRDIDFRVRVRKGRVLDGAEALELSEYLRTIGPRTAAIIERAKEKNPNISAPDTVEGQEWYRRCRCAASYIKQLAGEARDQADLTAIERTSVTEEIENATLLIVDGVVARKSGPQPALTREQRLVLLEAMLPGSATNPFQAAYQFRNFALISTYWENGLRRSEPLGLMGKHLSPGGGPPILTLERRPHERQDIRARAPSVKTMPRLLPITTLLHNVLWEYITDHRRKLVAEQGGAAALRRLKSHEYIFVSSQGGPLSLSAVYKIFDALRMRTEGLPLGLTPHALRRTWNDMFTELGQERLGPRETEIREYLMGWARGSRQPAHYARLSAEREAARVIVEMQREWMARRREMEQCKKT
ncbi:integrase [Bradyrhizobium sp. USDA 372]